MIKLIITMNTLGGGWLVGWRSCLRRCRTRLETLRELIAITSPSQCCLAVVVVAVAYTAITSLCYSTSVTAPWQMIK